MIVIYPYIAAVLREKTTTYPFMLHTLQTTDRNSKVWWRCGGRHQCVEGEGEDGDTRPPLSGVPTLSRGPHLGPLTQTVVAAGVLTDGMMES